MPQTAERQVDEEANGLRVGAQALSAGFRTARDDMQSALTAPARAKNELGIQFADEKVNNAMARLLFSIDLKLNWPQVRKLLAQIPNRIARNYFCSVRATSARSGGALIRRAIGAGQGGPSQAQ